MKLLKLFKSFVATCLQTLLRQDFDFQEIKNLCSVTHRATIPLGYKNSLSIAQIPIKNIFIKLLQIVYEFGKGYSLKKTPEIFTANFIQPQSIINHLDFVY